jgi:hypothetical protein
MFIIFFKIISDATVEGLFSETVVGKTEEV